MAPSFHHGHSHPHGDVMDEEKQQILDHIEQAHRDIRKYLMEVVKAHNGEPTTWMSASRFFFGDYNHASEAKAITICCVILMTLLAITLVTMVVVWFVKYKGVQCKGRCKGYSRQQNEKVHPVEVDPDQHPKAKEALASENDVTVTVVASTDTGSDITARTTESATPPPSYDGQVLDPNPEV